MQLRIPSKTSRWVTLQYERGALPIKQLTPRYPIPGRTPAPHLFKWWYQGKHKLWQPFSPADDAVIEKAFQSSGTDFVFLSGGRSVNVRGDLLFEGGGAAHCKVMRARWHYQPADGDGTLQPMGESEEAALEEAFWTRPIVQRQDKELHRLTQGLSSLKAEDVGLGANAFINRAGQQNLAWAWMKESCLVACMEPFRDCLWVNLPQDQWASLTIEDRVHSAISIAHVLSGAIASSSSSAPAPSAAASKASRIRAVTATEEGRAELAKSLAFVLVAAQPLQLASAIDAMSKYRTQVTKMLQRFGMKTDSVVDKEQEVVVRCLEEAAGVIREWAKARGADASTCEEEAATEEGEGRVVKLGEDKVVVAAKEGGYVQTRADGSGKPDAVVRGFHAGVLAIPSEMTPKVALGAAQGKGEEVAAEEEVKEIVKAAEEAMQTHQDVEALLLSQAGPGKQPVVTEKMDVGGGIVINFCKVGTEGPAVVLLHGFGGGLALWAQNLRGLASSYTVYALDLPGHAGSSAPPKTSATLAKDLAKDLANDLLPDALSEKLALDPAERAEKDLVEPLERWRQAMCEQGHDLSKMAIVGHSLGGYVGLCYALKYPSAVKKLILADPWGLSAPSNESDTKMALPTKQRIIMSPSLITSHVTQSGGTITDTSSVFQILCDSFVSKARMKRIDGSRLVDLDKRRTFLRYLEHCSHDTELVEALWAGGNPLWAARPLNPRLKADLPSHVKVTTIYGSQTWVDASGGMELYQLLPEQSFVAVIPGAGHHVFAENPSAFNEAVAARMAL